MAAEAESPTVAEPSAEAHATDLSRLLLSLIASRHSVAPKRLQAPGPDDGQLLQMVNAAACAPDHRGLRPWRLLRIADHQRTALADLFEACLRDRSGPHDPAPSEPDVARSRDKAQRAPCLLLAVLKTTPDDPEVPLTERAVALGAALMNLLLAAHGLGFAAMLTSGRAVRSARFAQAMGLAADEQAVCFVAIGSARWPSGAPAPARPTTWATGSPDRPQRLQRLQRSQRRQHLQHLQRRHRLHGLQRLQRPAARQPQRAAGGPEP